MNPLPRETHVRQFAFSLGVLRSPEAPSIDFMLRNSASEKQSQRTTQSINSDKKSN